MNHSPDFHLRRQSPNFDDLPWERSITEWEGICQNLAQVATGLSRHPVVFVNYDGELYAIKELPRGKASQEYQALLKMEELRLPSVEPIGFINFHETDHRTSILITRYLEGSLPYRTLFMSTSLKRYRQHLLDAMAWLLVQLHLSGIFWGDCSLSNTLFRRDAGMLQAYLVDAETTEVTKPRLVPTLRYQDLEIMEVNVTGDIDDLIAAGWINPDLQLAETGIYLRQRYRALWDEVTREETILPGESFRIQERIRALNALGFAVEEIETPLTPQGETVRLRISVTDRNFHRDLLMELTGLETEEMQARTMINEIRELKSILSHQRNQSLPLSAAAYHWYENIYKPVTEQLIPLISERLKTQPVNECLEIVDPAELYCEILEHKWYLSERAQKDVGHFTAAEDYLNTIGASLAKP